MVSETTTFTATYTDPETNCPGSASVTVDVIDPPATKIFADFCSNPGYVILSAEGGKTGANYVWRDSEGKVITSGINKDEITVDIIDVYSVTITNPEGCSATDYLSIGTEMIVDGSFESFNPNNMTFNTDYIYEADNPTINTELRYGGIPPYTGGEGKYGVGTNANNYHPNFWGRDHTTGNGNFMIVNGLGSSYIVWEQKEKILIYPGVNYYFSAWMLSLNSDGNDARLRFEIQIDGRPAQQIGSTANVQRGQTNNNNPWLSSGRFYGNWTTPSTITEPIYATVRIINTRTDPSGNDFGLDDISFGTLDPFPVEIQVAYDPVCEGGTLQLFANKQYGKSPFTYLWNGPNGWTSTEENPVIGNVTMDNAGLYHLEATDGFGCGVVADEITVTIDVAPTIDAGEDQTVCTANPVVQLNGSFTAPALSVLWSTDGNGSFDDDTKPDAVYTLHPDEAWEGNTITLTLTTDDPAGPCGPVSDQLVVTIFNSLEIEATGINPRCYEGEDGKATVNIIVPSVGPYTYDWYNTDTSEKIQTTENTNATSNTITGLTAGTYEIIVTDDNGCTATQTVVINEPDEFITPTYAEKTTEPSCYGASDGTIEVTASGGTEPYRFSLTWPDGTVTVETGTTVVFENLPAGSYIVDIEDGAGCGSTSFYADVNEPDPPKLFCPPNAEGEITDDGCSMVVAQIQNPVITGFCEPYTISYVLAGVTTGNDDGLVNNLQFSIGTTIVEYTVTDGVGNTVSCTFEVTVLRLEIPEGVITCSDDKITLNVDENCEAEIVLNLPEIDDPCGEEFTITHNSEFITAIDDEEGTATALFPVGVHTVTWTIISQSGHSFECVQQITVVDNTEPLFENCPEPGTVYEDEIADDGCTLINADIPIPEITENCEVQSLT